MSGIIPERVARLRELAGLSQTSLGGLIGTSQASIQRIEAGETVHPRKIVQLASALNTTIEYLTGETDEPSPQLADDRQAYRPAPSREASDTVDIPQIDLRFGLGATYLDDAVDAKPRPFSRSWLREVTKAAPSNLFWAIGDGDSMEPTIRSGELVLIERSLDTIRATDGIWAVAVGEVGMIKRLRPLTDGRIELLSDNSVVPPAYAADGELHLIGRVVAVVRRL